MSIETTFPESDTSTPISKPDMDIDIDSDAMADSISENQSVITHDFD